MLPAHVRHWIFDLDGTLTKPAHDFAAIRTMLGLSQEAESGILEQLAELSPEESAPLFVRLDAFELDLAHASQASDGALILLEALHSRGVQTAIVTRNNDLNVDATLKAAGLDGHFDRKDVITRETGLKPKPEPDGLLHLANQWAVPPDQIVMIGNHLVDVEAGRAAGTVTVLLDQAGEFEWGYPADFHIRSLRELI
jgi:HAD superfamily hydrolase (TIGR01509 family)